MKKEQVVPQSVLDTIQSESQRAIMTMLKGYTDYTTLPIRVAGMRIDRPSRGMAVEPVIVPATIIYLSPNGVHDEDTIYTEALKYVIQNTSKPFPFGHVYTSTGHLCLGDIFVPSKISKYNPQQPLETLFLYNDHNTSHGSAKVVLTPTTVDRVLAYIHEAGIDITSDIEKTFLADINLIANDAIWILSAEVASQTSNLGKALVIMENVYSQIFSDL